jgi:hypothetical protein
MNNPNCGGACGAAHATTGAGEKASDEACAGNCDTPDHSLINAAVDFDPARTLTTIILANDPAAVKLRAAISAYKKRCTANIAAYQKACADAYTTLTQTLASIDSPLARTRCEVLKAQAAVQAQSVSETLTADSGLDALSILIEKHTFAVTKHATALAAATNEEKALFEAQVAAIDGVCQDATTAASRTMSTDGEAADAELRAAYEAYDTTQTN